MVVLVTGANGQLGQSLQHIAPNHKAIQFVLRTKQTPTLYFLTLSITPLLGSLITEPAAMTLAAFLLRDLVYRHKCSTPLLFGTLGVLFVNISIGGTLTHFAAPPVLMVAAKWQWDTVFMLTHFGWKAALAVVANATLATLLLLFIFYPVGRSLGAALFDDDGAFANANSAADLLDLQDDSTRR